MVNAAIRRATALAPLAISLVAACRGDNPAFCPGGSDPTGNCIVDATQDSTDIAPDSLSCYGRSGYNVCLRTLPASPIDMTDATNVGTDSSDCNGDTPDTTLCVVAGTDLTIGAHLIARGSRPLVLLATGTLHITSDGYVDAAATVTAGGPGADLSCGSGGTQPAGVTAGGGGAGGSFAALGGNGGSGGNPAAGGTAGVAANAVGIPAMLQGGCSGQNGAATTGGSVGPRGFGGGGVYLIGGTALAIEGTVDASGSPGGGGHTMNGGGGGGGGGGMIIVTAPTVTTMAGAQVFANGGGGGAGAGGASAGGAGSASVMAFGAPTGGAAVMGAGSGGIGAYHDIAATAGMSSGGAGGGGGGGGAGVILVLHGALTNAAVSPSPM